MTISILSPTVDLLCVCVCVYRLTKSARYSIRSLCISKEKHKTLAKTNNFTQKMSILLMSIYYSEGGDCGR